MKDKPNYYAILPAAVRYDKELKSSEKILYAEITALANKEGYCWSTNNYFAELYEVTKVTISTWISNLCEKGYIQRKLIYKDNSKEVLKRKLIPIKEKFNTPIKENFKDSSFTNNTSLSNNTRTNNNLKEKINKKEKNILSIMKKIPNYPFEPEKDLSFIRELKKEFSAVDFVKETKKWKTYKLDKPLKKDSNSRLQYRNWIENSKKYNKEYQLEETVTDEMADDYMRRISGAKN